MMGKFTLTFWLLSFGSDAATSHMAIQSGKGREYLLPVKSPVAVDLVVAGQAVAGYWALGKLKKHHPKLAKTLTWTIIGIHGAAAIHNASLLR